MFQIFGHKFSAAISFLSLPFCSKMLRQLLISPQQRNRRVRTECPVLVRDAYVAYTWYILKQVMSFSEAAVQ